MVAWLLSGPLYMPIITLGCITPTTRKRGLVDLHASCPPGPPCRRGRWPARRPGTPRAASRARSSSLRKRPPACGMRLRISPKDGSTPRMRAFTVLVPAVHAATRSQYSRLMAAISGMRAAEQLGVLVGEARSRARRAGPRRRCVVAPGQSTPMPSPMPRVLLVEGALHALAEGEQQHDRERAPGDGQHGERDALAVVGGVGPEEPPDQRDLGAARSSGELQRHHGVEQRGPPRGEVARPRRRWRPAGRRWSGSRAARPRACPTYSSS